MKCVIYIFEFLSVWKLAVELSVRYMQAKPSMSEKRNNINEFDT